MSLYSSIINSQDDVYIYHTHFQITTSPDEYKRMAWQWAETLVEIADFSGTTT